MYSPTVEEHTLTIADVDNETLLSMSTSFDNASSPSTTTPYQKKKKEEKQEKFLGVFTQIKSLLSISKTNN